MFISRIEIKNFRIFDDVGIVACFKKGVNAIISENNCGKSAIIDAIRIAFSTVPYKKDIYFNISDFHIKNDGKRSSEAIISIYLEEVPADFYEIWNPEETTKGEFHIRYYIVPTQDGKEKVRYSIWGGPVEGNPVSADTFESIRVSFLGALRDAETEMRPARSSKLASLFGTVTSTDAAKDSVTEVLRKANRELLANKSLIRVGEIVNENLSTIEQDVLKQRIELGLVEPRFDSIAASLRAWLKPRWFYVSKAEQDFASLQQAYSKEEWSKYVSEDDAGAFLDIWMLKSLKKDLPAEAKALIDDLSNNSFDLYQNGLGYNNIIFMSAVLGDMETSSTSALFCLLLVEEPEAHLHPQLQNLVHSFFENNASRSNLQVIYTSHSPTLVSRIGIDKTVLLYENNHRINCLSLSESNLDENDRDSLERYLDVTKSQMLFARGIVFVEGICEALLLPILAEYIERPLDKFAVEIVNVDGVSFKPFADLLCYANDVQRHTIRATIITDDDRCTDKGVPDIYIGNDYDYDTDDLNTIVGKLKSSEGSARFQMINTLCEGAHINIFSAKKTFEYELACEPDNIPYILDAISQAQPVAGLRLNKYVATLDSNEKKAACIWLYIRERSKYKGEIAQNLARRLQKELPIITHPEAGFPLIDKPFVIPSYIKNAIFSVTYKG